MLEKEDKGIYLSSQLLQIFLQEGLQHIPSAPLKSKQGQGIKSTQI